MSDFVHLGPPERETIVIIDFRVDPSFEEAQFHGLLVIGGDNHRPAMAGDRILIFGHSDLAAVVAGRADNLPGDSAEQLADAAHVACDIAEALHIVNSQSDDANELVYDCLSILDDLVRATKINVPAVYMGVLSTLMERLEEKSEFGSYLTEHGLDREQIEDGIMWCVGAVAVKSTWVG
jgi:hypothetical protein